MRTIEQREELSPREGLELLQHEVIDIHLEELDGKILAMRTEIGGSVAPAHRSVDFSHDLINIRSQPDGRFPRLLLDTPIDVNTLVFDDTGLAVVEVHLTDPEVSIDGMYMIRIHHNDGIGSLSIDPSPGVATPGTATTISTPASSVPSTPDTDVEQQDDGPIRYFPDRAAMKYGERISRGYDTRVHVLGGNGVVPDYYIDLGNKGFIGIGSDGGRDELKIRRKEETIVTIPFTDTQVMLPNVDGALLTLNIDAHAYDDDHTLGYTDVEGDTWTIQLRNIDGILTLSVDAPLQEKIDRAVAIENRKQQEKEEKKKRNQERKENIQEEIDKLKEKFKNIKIPEWENTRPWIENTYEDVKEKIQEAVAQISDGLEPYYTPNQIKTISQSPPPTIDGKEVMKYVRKVYPLPPASMSQVEHLYIEKTNGVNEFVLKYDDWINKKLLTFTLDGTKTIEKDGWKFQCDVDAAGVMTIGVLPPEAYRNKTSPEVMPGGMLWPIPGKTVDDVNSGLGMRRGKPHNGIDIDAHPGSPIVAPMEGTVFIIDDYPKRGHTVMLVHKIGGVDYRTIYAHLTPGSTDHLKPGDTIGQGEPLAKSGGKKGAPGAGNSTGPHLHFELRRYDKHYKGKMKYRKPLDPLNFSLQTSSGSAPQSPQQAPNTVPTLSTQSLNPPLDIRIGGTPTTVAKINPTIIDTVSGDNIHLPDGITVGVSGNKIHLVKKDGSSVLLFDEHKHILYTFDDTGGDILKGNGMVASFGPYIYDLHMEYNKTDKVLSIHMTNVASSGGGQSGNNAVPNTIQQPTISTGPTLQPLDEQRFTDFLKEKKPLHPVVGSHKISGEKISTYNIYLQDSGGTPFAKPYGRLYVDTQGFYLIDTAGKGYLLPGAKFSRTQQHDVHTGVLECMIDGKGYTCTATLEHGKLEIQIVSR